MRSMTAKSSAMAMITIMVMGITMILPTYSFAQTTEDDGYTYDSDDPEEQQEQDEHEQEAWEDAGRPGDDDDSSNNNGNDDDGPNPYCDLIPDNYHGVCHDRKDYYQGGPKNGLYPCNDGTDKADWRDCKDATNNNGNDKDLPICEYLVVKDCVVNEIGQKCLVGTSDDPCQDIFYGYDGNLKPGEKTFNPNNDNDNGGSNSGSGSDDLPGCQNGVLQKCVIKQIGLICHPEDRYAPTNPSVVGGGHACQDVYAGHYVYDTKEYKPGEIIGQSDDGSVLKNCGDGIIAVSCGVGRYQCMNGDGSGKSFHTNDYRDCEEP